MNSDTPPLSVSSAQQLDELVGPIRRELHRVLEGLPREGIDAFAWECFGCIGEHLVIDSHFGESTRIEALAQLRRNVRSALRLIPADPTSWTRLSPRTLPTAVTGRPEPFYCALYAGADQSDDNADAPYWRALRQFREAAAALDAELHAATTAPQRRRGRPAADARKMLSVIARRYMEIFNERPTTTPGGRFSNVAIIVLAELKGIEPEDVSRHVRAAVRAL